MNVIERIHEAKRKIEDLKKKIKDARGIFFNDIKIILLLSLK